MSKTTSSPAPISRSPGSACGRAPFSPAAMIGGKEGSAPSSRILASQARATSLSVCPASPRSIVQRKTPSASSDAAAIRSISSGSFTARSLSTRSPAGTRSTSSPTAASQAGELPHAQLGVLEADPPVHSSRDLRHQLALGLRSLPLLPHLALGTLRVAEIGEEDPLLEADQAGAIRPREAGEVADVRQVGDEELIELAFGDQLDQAVRPAHTPSLLAISSSASW